MASDSEIELDPSSLKLLGSYYTNDFSLRLCKTGDEISLRPPKSITGSMIAMSLVIGLLVVGFGWAGAANGAADTLGLLFWALVSLIGAIAIGGPLIANYLRFRYLNQRSPLVSYSKRGATVAILAGSRVFASEDVYALIGVALSDSHGEVKSELQLAVRSEEGLEFHLIKTDLTGYAEKTYGKVLREFRNHTGIRTLAVESPGWLKRGPLEVKEIAASR